VSEKGHDDAYSELTSEVFEALENSPAPTNKYIETEKDGISLMTYKEHVITDYGPVGLVRYNEIGEGRDHPISLGSRTYVVGILDELNRLVPVIWQDVRDKVEEKVEEEIQDPVEITFQPPGYFSDLRDDWSQSSVLSSAIGVIPPMGEENEEFPSISEIRTEIEKRENARTVSNMKILNQSRSDYYAYVEHDIIPEDPERDTKKAITVLGKVIPEKTVDIEPVEEDMKEAVSNMLEDSHTADDNLGEVMFAEDF